MFSRKPAGGFFEKLKGCSEATEREEGRGYPVAPTLALASQVLPQRLADAETACDQHYARAQQPILLSRRAKQPCPGCP